MESETNFIKSIFNFNPLVFLTATGNFMNFNILMVIVPLFISFHLESCYN